jgi:hypothetical protein
MQTSHLPHRPAIIHFQLDCVAQQHNSRTLERIRHNPLNTPEWISANTVHSESTQAPSLFPHFVTLQPFSKIGLNK